MAIGGHGEFVAGEGADEDEEAGLRQMEICEHRVDALELEAGIDEEIRLAGVAELVEGLDGADGGGADGHHASRVLELDLRVLAHFEAFEMEFVLFDGLGMERLKSAEAHVERDFGAAGRALIENVLGEVEASRGRRDAAAFPGENGLVAFRVGRVIGTTDVGWERNVTVRLNGVPVVIGIEPDAAFAVFETLLNNGVEAGGEFDARTGRKFASGADERSPGVAELFGEEDLDATGVAGTVTDEAGFEDAGIVEDEKVVGVEVCGEIAKCAVLPGLRLAIEDQHAGAVALRQGMLGDQLLREVIIELREVQTLRLTTCAY